MGEIGMTIEEMFKSKIKVTKGNHWCMFCDFHEADFVITNNNTDPIKEFPMCKKCAVLFKEKIDNGLNLESR